jgi:hypothetical protein
MREMGTSHLNFSQHFSPQQYLNDESSSSYTSNSTIVPMNMNSVPSHITPETPYYLPLVLPQPIPLRTIPIECYDYPTIIMDKFSYQTAKDENGMLFFQRNEVWISPKVSKTTMRRAFRRPKPFLVKAVKDFVRHKQLKQKQIAQALGIR